MIMFFCFLKSKNNGDRYTEACSQQKWPEGKLSFFTQQHAEFCFISLHEPISMQTYQFIFLQCFAHSIDVGYVFLNQNDVYFMTASNAFKIVLDLLVLSIEHNNVDACIQPLQQMSGGFPIPHVSAQQNSTFASSYDFPKIFFPIKVISEFIFDPGHYDYFVQ